MFSCAVEGCKHVVEFIFPSNAERKKKWLEAIRRPTYIPKKRHGLCSRHFKIEHFILESRDGGFKNSRRILRKDAVPCVFAWNIPHSQFDTQADYDIKPVISDQLSRVRFDIPIKQEDQSQDDVLQNVDNCTTMDIQTGGCGDNIDDEITIKDEPLWPYDPAEEEKCTTVSTSTQTPRSLAIMAIEHFRDRPDAVLYYTGLESYTKFMTVLDSLGEKVHKLQYPDSEVMDVSIADQLFMTLWKLKRNCTDFELSINFDVSKGTISDIICTWIRLMAQEWSKMDIWPSKKLVQCYMPPNFHTNYNFSRIIDGTEITAVKHQNLRIQQSAFNTYKNRNIASVFIGDASESLISNCSMGYGRSNSGRHMMKRSSLLDKSDLGDSIIEDKGFNLRDIFTPKNVKFNISTVLKSKYNSPAKTVLNDRRLVKHRIHIERVIELAKTYKVLDTTLSYQYVPLATNIFSVIIMLCNFRKGIT